MPMQRYKIYCGLQYFDPEISLKICKININRPTLWEHFRGQREELEQHLPCSNPFLNRHSNYTKGGGEVLAYFAHPFRRKRRPFPLRADGPSASSSRPVRFLRNINSIVIFYREEYILIYFLKSWGPSVHSCSSPFPTNFHCSLLVSASA